MTNPAGPVSSRSTRSRGPLPLRPVQLRGPRSLPASGDRFAPYADAVAALELTYRRQLSGSGRSHDLDSRDPHYDHFLLVERSSGALAGSARLQFVPQRGANAAQGPLPQGHQSYLEHVYPGLKATLASRGNHLEIGRVALAPRFQRLPHTLMCLFRGGLQVAVSSGYDSIHGLVSYNHFAYPEAVNSRFLSNLLRPPFLQQDPPPLHRAIPWRGSSPTTNPGRWPRSRPSSSRSATNSIRRFGCRCCCASTST